MLVYSTGCGVNGFTFDPSIGEFFLSHPDMRFPDNARVYSMNESYLDKLDSGVKPYVKECRSRGMTARYTGALVADFHRNLIHGGIYLYPGLAGSPKANCACCTKPSRSPSSPTKPVAPPVATTTTCSTSPRCRCTSAHRCSPATPPR